MLDLQADTAIQQPTRFGKSVEYPDSVLSAQDSLNVQRQYWARVKVWREQQAKLSVAKAYESAAQDSLYQQSWCFGDQCHRREQRSEYKLVLSPPGRLAVEPRPQTAMNSDGISFLLIILFVFTTLSFQSGYRSVFHRIRYLFEVKKRENIFFDSTVNEANLRSVLLLCLFVLEGIAIYSISLKVVPQIAWFNVTIMVLCAAGMAALYYFVQLFQYYILGYIFSNKENRTLMVESYISVNLILCIVLFPFVLALIYYPAYPRSLLYIIAFIYLISRIIFIYRGVKIFLRDIYGILYFILYLCALEIVPLLVLYKGTILLYNFVELRLI